MRTLVWFRNDLRVADHPALHHAMTHGETVAVFCICSRQWRDHGVGDNRLGFLLDSLHALAASCASSASRSGSITEPWFDRIPRAAGEPGAEALRATRSRSTRSIR